MKDDLEELLKKSARLLFWHDKNKDDKRFQTYFDKHFCHLRTLGYIACLNEIDSNSVEVYFRVYGNCDYRTKGEVIRYIN